MTKDLASKREHTNTELANMKNIHTVINIFKEFKLHKNKMLTELSIRADTSINPLVCQTKIAALVATH